jgi:solute carrier family 35 protein E3
MTSGLTTIGWIVGSVASSTSIIMMNKHVMDDYGFSWPISLTAYHFVMTWGLLELMCRLHLFERADSFPWSQRWFLGAATVAAVVFMNFNLQLNSVGFYQLSKLLVIPTIVVYSFIFEKKTTPVATLASLAILLVGIALFTVNDVQANLPGTVMAGMAVAATAVSQTKTGAVQREYRINGPSAQHATAFPQFLVALISALAVDTHGTRSLFGHSFQKAECVVIILTGFVSVFVNMCAFGLIGKTSAVTYQVVGHCKTILIFVFGLVMFPAKEGETTAQFVKKVVGLVVSMSGMILYTYLQLKGKKSEPEPVKGDFQQLLEDQGRTDQDLDMEEAI